MEPYCNHLALEALEARKAIRTHQAELINHADRIYLIATGFVFGTLLSVEAYSVWTQLAS